MTGSRAEGASGAGGAQDAPEGAGPKTHQLWQWAATGSQPETTTTMEVVASLVMSEADAGDPTTSTSPAAGAPSSPPQMVAATASTGTDDNTIEEHEVFMGHLGLWASGAISLFEVMGMTHFALN
jgi:hypothetical protein